jgi:hypothetical protein
VRLLALVMLAAAFVPTAGGCGGGGGSDASRRAAGSNHRLRDLRDIAELRSLFNARVAEPRLILLISPT